MDDAARRLSRYFLSQFAANAGVGVVIGAGLFLIGIPSPVLWGILAALLRLVPYVGIWIVAILAIALAAAVSPEWSMAIWSLALFVIVELLAGQVIEPMLYGHSTGISPFSVVVAAIFWSWILGPVGLILSTPLTLCLVVLGRHFGRLEMLDVLLGDQPTLTPVENFCQRALAGDPDETLEQAEILLRDRSLSSYYDEVAIKGLQLAASDMLLGVVTAAQLARIETTVTDLVEGLDSFADIEPSPAGANGHKAALEPYIAEHDSHHPGPSILSPNIETSPARSAEGHVLCIAGTGPLDELASTIVAQLLGKHDLDCRVVPHDAASRARMQGLDVIVPTIVCIFYLNIEGIPSHLPLSGACSSVSRMRRSSLASGQQVIRISGARRSRAQSAPITMSLRFGVWLTHVWPRPEPNVRSILSYVPARWERRTCLPRQGNNHTVSVQSCRRAAACSSPGNIRPLLHSFVATMPG